MVQTQGDKGLLGYDLEYRIRMALAAQAHDADVVRLANADLTGCTHLIACRKGLFAANRDETRLIVHGQFYGITIDDDTIHAFEACGRPRERGSRGRIVRLRHEGGYIVEADVLACGLDNGCHQLDLIDDRIVLTDTYNQRLLSFPRKGGEATTLHPLLAPDDPSGPGYLHVNSLLAHRDRIYLLLHNDSLRSGRDSEIAIFDRSWRRTGTIPLAGQGCHNLAILEDGMLIACGSAKGELVGPDGWRVAVSDRMTRGLSIDDEMVVVGGSVKLERAVRDEAPGEVYFLDRDYRLMTTLSLPGPVMEIRRIDGRDRSLSAYLKSCDAGADEDAVGD